MKRSRATLLAALGVAAFGGVAMADKTAGTRSGASAKDGTVASSGAVASVATDGTGNLSKQRREELVKKIAEIRRFLAKSSDTNAVRLVAFADELAKEVKAKKYGLVFEEHKEKIDVQLEHNLPMLTEDKNRFIDNGGELNFLIEGDNLAALKLLEKTHRGKIDLIYIDPPYNTGNKDFVYNDHIVDVLDTYRHSKWLSFMKRRLEAARKLMSEDGVIFISIDDNEQANLRLLCDEVFGEGNNVAQIMWHKNYASANDSKTFSKVLDYILVYQKTSKFKRNLLPRTDKQNVLYKYDSNDGKGAWRPDNLSVRSYSANYDYPIVNPNTGVSYMPPKGRCWMTTRERVAEWIKETRVYFGLKGTGAPQLKRYLSEVQQGVVPTTYWDYDSFGHNDEARRELKEIFDGKALFDSPKPTRLLEKVVQVGSDASASVLDFFAGSGTTGHAVMSLNAKDSGKRKFILVTNNENGICEKVTYERLKRVIEKENYAARLKYMKIDYLPIEERMYDRYAENLLKHVRELVELENGLDFEHETGVAIVLTDGEAEALAKDKKRLAACRVIYKGHNVLLGAKTAAAFEKSGVTIRPIPKYYYPELEY